VRKVLAKKILIAITFALGIFSGAISFLSHNFLLSLSLSSAIYFSCYLAFRSIFELEEFVKETAIGYFGLWFITWTLLINLV
jgi:hypothetical protein